MRVRSFRGTFERALARADGPQMRTAATLRRVFVVVVVVGVVVVGDVADKVRE